MFFKWFLSHILLVILLLGVALPGEAAEKTTDLDENTGQKRSLTELYTWSNSLAKALADLERAIDGTTDVSDLPDQIPPIAREIDALAREISTVHANSHRSYHQLSSMEARLAKIDLQLDALYLPIEADMEQLENWYGEWLGKKILVHTLQTQADQQPELYRTMPASKSLEQLLDTGKKRIEKQMHLFMEAGNKVAALQDRVNALGEELSFLIREIRGLSISRTSPSMLTAAFYQRLDGQLLAQGWQDICLFGKYQLRYLQQSLHGIIICLAAILILVLVISLSKPLGNHASSWSAFASQPLATGVFIVSISFVLVNTLPVRITLPPEWDRLLLLPMLWAVATLSGNVCATLWQRKLLRHISLLLMAIQFFTIMELPQPLLFLLVFFLALLGFLFCLHVFHRRLLAPAGQRGSRTICLWALYPGIILVAGILGYDQFAVFFFGMVLSTTVATMVICLMVQMSTGLLEVLLLNVRFQIIRQNAVVIVQHLRPVLLFFHGLLWLSFLLVILRVYPTVAAVWAALISMQFTLYALTITPGSVLVVVFVCYATLLCSRGFRAFLLQVILPRYGVKSGAQVSISRLVHYAILTVGFFILLKILGFSLGQITILGGALGVGIGFGLQTIVNNVVSGLILLFERPIKIGDMVEVGAEVGEVKELGLRATIVQTFDNAEIVIPNSELISSSVTNWTLAEKQVRVKVPVGVAYGSNIPAVLTLLLSSASAHPMVLDLPQPKAHFLAFGASSLDFELWVWIHDFSDRVTVLSEINQDLASRFQVAGIEIPFPQTDLHLRSIDREAVSVLQASNSAFSGLSVVPSK